MVARTADDAAFVIDLDDDGIDAMYMLYDDVQRKVDLRWEPAYITEIVKDYFDRYTQAVILAVVTDDELSLEDGFDEIIEEPDYSVDVYSGVDLYNHALEKVGRGEKLSELLGLIYNEAEAEIDTLDDDDYSVGFQTIATAHSIVRDMMPRVTDYMEFISYLKESIPSKIAPSLRDASRAYYDMRSNAIIVIVPKYKLDARDDFDDILTCDLDDLILNKYA